MACSPHPMKLKQAFQQLIMYFTFVMLGWIWLYTSPVILERFTVLFFLCMSIVFGKMATHMILAHVTHMSFPNLYWNLLSLFLGTLISILTRYFDIKWSAFLLNSSSLFISIESIESIQWEGFYLSFMLFYEISSHLNWSRKVIDGFCKHLGISCFTIPNVKNVKKQE